MRLTRVCVFLAVGAAAFHPPPCGRPSDGGRTFRPSATCRAPAGARFLAAFRQAEDETAPLSVDEMMQAVQAQFGDDVENEEALRAAFEAALRDDARPPPPRTTAGTRGVQVELKSGLLRGAASLVFELRSFAHGAREDFALLQAKAVEKAKVVEAAQADAPGAELDAGSKLAINAGSIITWFHEDIKNTQMRTASI